jgi:hypothetical protein
MESNLSLMNELINFEHVSILSDKRHVFIGNQFHLEVLLYVFFDNDLFFTIEFYLEKC